MEVQLLIWKSLFSGCFKGKFHNGGKLGHKTSECKAAGGGAHKSFGNKDDKNKNSGITVKKNSKIECFYCHEKGHFLQDCPKLQNKK